MFINKIWYESTPLNPLPKLSDWQIWRGDKQGLAFASNALKDAKLDIVHNREDIDENRMRIIALEERMDNVEARVDSAESRLDTLEAMSSRLTTFMETVSADAQDPILASAANVFLGWP